MLPFFLGVFLNRFVCADDDVQKPLTHESIACSLQKPQHESTFFFKPDTSGCPLTLSAFLSPASPDVGSLLPLSASVSASLLFCSAFPVPVAAVPSPVPVAAVVSPPPVPLSFSASPLPADSAGPAGPSSGRSGLRLPEPVAAKRTENRTRRDNPDYYHRRRSHSQSK
jgi:hypothetical protein